MDTSTPTFMLGFLGDLFTAWSPFLIPFIALFLLATVVRLGIALRERALDNARHRATRRTLRNNTSRPAVAKA